MLSPELYMFELEGLGLLDIWTYKIKENSVSQVGQQAIWAKQEKFVKGPIFIEYNTFNFLDVTMAGSTPLDWSYLKAKNSPKILPSLSSLLSLLFSVLFTIQSCSLPPIVLVLLMRIPLELYVFIIYLSAYRSICLKTSQALSSYKG